MPNPRKSPRSQPPARGENDARAPASATLPHRLPLPGAPALAAVLLVLLPLGPARPAAAADPVDAFLSAPPWVLTGEPIGVRIELRRAGAPLLAPVVLGLDPADPRDGAGDLDSDGLGNVEEYRADTDPRRGDSDGDGLGDLEEARSASSDPLVADSDGDGALDGADPRPGGIIDALLKAPRAALVGRPFALEVRLEPREELRSQALPITLELPAGSGRFAPRAEAGRIVAAPSATRVELETEGAVARVSFTPEAPVRLEPAVIDGAGLGIRAAGGRTFDLERDSGGFESLGAGGGWRWGRLEADRVADPSPPGDRVWATDLAAPPAPGSLLRLQTPELSLPEREEVHVLFWHRLRLLGDGPRASLSVSARGSAFLALQEWDGDAWSPAGFQRARADLSPWRGRPVRLRFDLQLAPSAPDGEVSSWAIDDLSLRWSRAAVEAVVPEGDADSDGAANGAELALGTDLLCGDSDRDGLPDGVETATGRFVGPRDRGTDPLLADSDGGGWPDGLEARCGLDPLDPGDDPRPIGPSISLSDAGGLAWTFLSGGRLRLEEAGGAPGPFDGFELSVDGSIFPLGEDLSLALGGRRQELFAGPRAVGDLEVARRISVPAAASGAVRYLELFHNRAETPLVVSVEIPPPSPPAPTYPIALAGEEGWTRGPRDDGFIIDDPDPDAGDALLIVDGGEGTEPGIDLLRERAEALTLEIPPRGTVALVRFLARSPTRSGARRIGEELRRLGGGALEGIPASVAATIRTIWIDADGDGQSDPWEESWGLDPARSSDGLEDPDGDGLPSAEEAEGTAGDWRHGAPALGDPPRSGPGRRLWEIRSRARERGFPVVSRLLSPFYELSGGSLPAIELESWGSGGDGPVAPDRSLAFSLDGGQWIALARPGDLPGDRAWSRFSQALPEEAAGHLVRFELTFAPGGDGEPLGWAVDNLRVLGTPASLEVLDGEVDEDGDGLSLAEELARGTDRALADTDGDGLPDGVETGTGRYAGPGDTGTDPAVADTDGAGMDDGEELRWGWDPLDPADDPERREHHVDLVDGGGTTWSVWRNGTISIGSGTSIYSPRFAFNVILGGRPVPYQSSILLGADRREVFVGPLLDGPIELVRRVRVSERESGLARCLDRFHNRGGEPARITVAITSYGGPELDIVPVKTSTSPGAAELRPEDSWLLFDDGDRAGRPAFLVVDHGPGARTRPEAAGIDSKLAFWQYVLDVPPGGTVRLLHFAAVDPLRSASEVRAAELLALEGGALEGISPDVLPTIVNFEAARLPEVFRRGDVDGSGRLDVSDAVRLLGWLFRGGPAPEVLDAADADDDGRIAITDAIAILEYLFRSGPPLPPPFPEAGIDPTADEIGRRG